MRSELLALILGATVTAGPALYARKPLKVVAVKDYTSIATLTCSDSTSTLTGAAVDDTLKCGWPASLATGLSPSCRVSSANTVTFRLCNVTADAIDPAAGNFIAEKD